MKLSVLFALMLALGGCQLEEDQEKLNMACMDLCLLDKQNEVANTHAELTLDLEERQLKEHQLDLQLKELQRYKQLEQQMRQQHSQQQHLAECRLSVQYFECTLKCVFQK